VKYRFFHIPVLSPELQADALNRSAYRNHNEPGNRNDNIGFRLALARWGGGCCPVDQISILSGEARAAGSSGEKQMAFGVLVVRAGALRRLAGGPTFDAAPALCG